MPWARPGRWARVSPVSTEHSEALQLLPAVDVKDGQAVQLVQGVAGSGKVFGDPHQAAKHWVEAGTSWLHLVDLDAAFGRGSNADLRVNDPGVSRRHAMISVSGPLENRTIRIEDLGSTNGIVVDGSRVQAAQLRDGSRIEIGNTRMLVHSPSEA